MRVDGWVKMGDIGRLDANGYLDRLDRADGMVKNVIARRQSRRKNWSSSVPFTKTPVGKIKRKELREPFRVARKRRVAGNRRRAARLRE